MPEVKIKNRRFLLDTARTVLLQNRIGSHCIFHHARALLSVNVR
jgi:hypothetical protein